MCVSDKSGRGHDGKPTEILYLAPAQRDLHRLLSFLLAADVPPARSKEMIMEIVQHIRVLESSPLIGFSIGGKYGFNTTYRALVCGKYIAVYEPVFDDTLKTGEVQRVEIRRIYHGREDSVAQLVRV